MRTFFTLTLLYFIFVSAKAQDNRRIPVAINGSVSGTVFDKDSVSSLPAVSVALYGRRDSTLVKSGQTDANGKFKLDVPKTGAYYLDVKFIGYKNKRIAPIILTADKPNFVIKKIVLKAKDNELNEVKVVAEPPMLEYSMDKTTLNVNSNAVAQGGTALELLQLVPNVNVNSDGTVQLRGSDKVKILMDGRPSMFNSLDQVPSEMLDKIEVMTNPSSKYEAEGTAGIINLITNKRKMKGYFVGGNVNVNSRSVVSGGLNASAKLGRFGFMANYNARSSDIPGNMLDSIRYSTLAGELLSTTTQTRTSHRRSLNQNLRLNADYSFDDKTILTLQAGFNFGNTQSSDTTTFNTQTLTNNADRFRGTHTQASNLNSNFVMAFGKKFDKPGNELTAEVSYNKNNSTSPNQIYDQSIFFSTQSIQNTSANNGFNIKIDYEKLLTEKLKLEIGERSNLSNTVTDYEPTSLKQNVLVLNDSLINKFDFERDIHSAYLIFTYPITEKLSTKLGARYEYTHDYGTQLSDNTKLDNSYWSLYPSLFFAYKLSDNQTLNLNYSRRFDRPNASQLNPKIDRSNPLAIKAGNTHLQPEDINSIELKYNYITKPIEVNSAIYYRHADSIITRSITYEGPVSVTSYKNEQTGNYFGGELSVQVKPTDWLRIGTSGNWNRTEVSPDPTDPNADTQLTTWLVKLNAMFNKPEICNFQVTGNYLGPIEHHTGNSKAVYSVDMALRKNFFNRKLSLFLKLNDVFNTKRTNATQTGFITPKGASVPNERFTDLNLSRETTRILTFGLNFNFSNMQRPKRDGKDGGDHERHGDGGGWHRD